MPLWLAVATLISITLWSLCNLAIGWKESSLLANSGIIFLLIILGTMTFAGIRTTGKGYFRSNFDNLKQDITYETLVCDQNIEGNYILIRDPTFQETIWDINQTGVTAHINWGDCPPKKFKISPKKKNGDITFIPVKD